MIINKYIQQWVEEDYDIRKEAFFIDNAYYVLSREWADGGFLYRWIGLAMFLLSWLWNLNSQGTVISLVHGCAICGITAISFWINGIFMYDANDPSGAILSSKMGLIFFWVLKQKLSFFFTVVLAIVGMYFYVKYTWINPIKFNRTTGKTMEKRIKEEEEKDAEEEQVKYKAWEQDYKKYRFGLPEFEVPKDDPLLAEARKLFEGYTKSKEMLKARFRQLAKMYHPDKGGDTALFQCIIEVHEELEEAIQNDII